MPIRIPDGFINILNLFYFIFIYLFNDLIFPVMEFSRLQSGTTAPRYSFTESRVLFWYNSSLRKKVDHYGPKPYSKQNVQHVDKLWHELFSWKVGHVTKELIPMTGSWFYFLVYMTSDFSAFSSIVNEPSWCNGYRHGGLSYPPPNPESGCFFFTLGYNSWERCKSKYSPSIDVNRKMDWAFKPWYDNWSNQGKGSLWIQTRPDETRY